MNTEKFQPVVTASAFVDEHPPAVWREGEGLMVFHGRLVPGRSGSFLLTLTAISPRKERREEMNFRVTSFQVFFFFFLSFSAQNVNLGFEDSTRSGMNAEIISAFCYYIYLFPPPPCSRTVTVQADKSKHEKTPTQPAFFWNYKFVMQRFGLWTFHLTVWVFILHLL